MSPDNVRGIGHVFPSAHMRTRYFAKPSAPRVRLSRSRRTARENLERERQIAMNTNETHQSRHRFILRTFDPTRGCPVLEALFRVADVETLRSLLGEDATADADLRYDYVLDSRQLQAITEQFEIAFDPQGLECWLSRARSIGDVPYLVHTGYELALMLDGRKPFAKFAVEYPSEPDQFPEEALFEPHMLAHKTCQG